MVSNSKSSQRKLLLLNTVFGKIKSYLNDEKVTDIMLNPDQTVWVEKAGEGQVKTNLVVSPNDSETLIKLIASNSDQGVVNKENPIVSTEIIGYGFRFEGVLPPVTLNPIFSIRKQSVIEFTLEDYLKQNCISSSDLEYIKKAVVDKKNIIIAGGTGSGKSTLTNAILKELENVPERIMIIEDTRELKCNSDNVVFMKATESTDMVVLLKSTMRQNPDRIVIGEVRGLEALALLKAWTTGHPGGVSTLHANNAKNALTRLEQLVLEAAVGEQKKLISEAVDIVLFIEKSKNNRVVSEIIEVNGFDNKNRKYLLKKIKEKLC